MASPLDGALKAAIAGGFKGQLKTGVVRRRVYGSGVNSLGDPASSSINEYEFASGIRQNFSAFFREQSGIPEEDLKFLVLLGSISIEPGKDDYIKLTSETQWYQIRKIVEIDPAGASIELQCTPCEEPT